MTVYYNQEPIEIPIPNNLCGWGWFVKTPDDFWSAFYSNSLNADLIIEELGISKDFRDWTETDHNMFQLHFKAKNDHY